LPKGYVYGGDTNRFTGLELSTGSCSG